LLQKINGRSTSSFPRKGLDGAENEHSQQKTWRTFQKAINKKQRRKISLPALRSFEQT
jgi:hypothetical protein